jgi:ubiquinone/menaquinone biosynthesis C-methylase UbiE
MLHPNPPSPLRPQVQVPLMREVYDAYSLHVIPAIGGLVARDAASYQYLVESIRQFPDQVRAVVTMLECWGGGSASGASKSKATMPVP